MWVISGRPTRSASSRASSSGADADAAGGVLVDARLDAQDQVAVGIDDRLRQIEIAIVEVGELPGRRDQPDRGEVQEREDARPARLGDEAAEPGPGIGSGRADVEPGRHPGARRDRIGLDAPVGRAPVDVGVQIDQPGRHDPARGVDHLARGGAVEIRRDLDDAAVPDRDVERALQPRPWVDDLTTHDQGVVNLVARRPRLPSRPHSSHAPTSTRSRNRISGARQPSRATSRTCGFAIALRLRLALRRLPHPRLRTIIGEHERRSGVAPRHVQGHRSGAGDRFRVSDESSGPSRRREQREPLSGFDGHRRDIHRRRRLRRGDGRVRRGQGINHASGSDPGRLRRARPGGRLASRHRLHRPRHDAGAERLPAAARRKDPPAGDPRRRRRLPHRPRQPRCASTTSTTANRRRSSPAATSSRSAAGSTTPARNWSRSTRRRSARRRSE